MPHIRLGLLPFFVAAIYLAGTPAAVRGQDAAPSPTSELGQETGNWGLAPFIPIPTLALSAEAKQSVRDLEDRQLGERRALEDRFNVELIALLKKQAGEREALILSFTGP